MAYDYDALYRSTPEALGAPTPALATLLEDLAPGASVLDLGCGQGRDALWLARRGHPVHGVDLSPQGIAQMLGAARAGGLAVTGEVADLTHWGPEQDFDVILLDRTLHMLPEEARLDALGRLLPRVAPGGRCLIADEPRNLPAFAALAKSHDRDWLVRRPGRGLLVLA